ncbi:MAG: LLM class flavin-dependent oxidoreductase [Alphaproteobacteria bacterium]|nr:LLM class flavin-dependent oxidoreductase [Alphaproteobacteria bacterium]
MKLSALDQSPIRKGGTAADAVRETIELATACERLGYARYWLAEHHNTASFAGSTPEVLIARVAAETKHIRVGSGGIMLPHYSPLKVAENFRMLETLYPGRIDLGLGRAPGADGRTSVALQAGPQAWDVGVFPQQVALLRHYLEEAAGLAEWPAGHAYRSVHASPRGPGMPEMWMLASTVNGALYAAELGLPLAFAQFISPDGSGPEAAELYRKQFKPHRDGDKPRVSVAVFTLCADTEEEAERLCTTRNLWVMQLLRNQAGQFPSPEEAQAYPYTHEDRVMIRGIASRGITGTPDRVKLGLERLAADYGAEEVIALTITYDFAARVRSYELLAGACGLLPR